MDTRITEAIAMQAVMQAEADLKNDPRDVHERNRWLLLHPSESPLLDQCPQRRRVGDRGAAGEVNADVGRGAPFDLAAPLQQRHAGGLDVRSAQRDDLVGAVAGGAGIEQGFVWYACVCESTFPQQDFPACS